MLWAIVLYIPIIIFFGLVVKATGSAVSPDVIFVVLNTIALVGTAASVNPTSEIELRYFWIVFSLTSAAALLIGVLRLGWKGTLRLGQAAQATPVRGPLLALYSFASLISLGYFAAVGHITLIEALQGGAAYDSTAARLDSYSGSTYFFPGYVNQFKNAILPITTAAIVHSLFVTRSAGRWPISTSLSAFAFVMVAGTGQRGAMVLSVLVLLTGLLLGRILKGSVLIGVLTTFFALFALQTVVLQRQADELAGSSGTFSQVQVFAKALWSRVVLENPQSGIAAFHYTETLPTAWGSEWAQDTVGLLPGQRGSDLSSKVFETLYGSTRGTAPPSIWGDIYYNFDLVGSIVVTSFLVTALVWLGRTTFVALNEDPGPTFLRVLAASGIAVSAGSWIAGSPASVLNQGFMAYVLIFISEPRLSGRLVRTPKAGARSGAASRATVAQRRASEEVASSGNSRSRKRGIGGPRPT